MSAEPEPSRAARRPSVPSKYEFVILIASLMALNALAIDIMLPALSEIGTDFRLVEENDRQLVIIAYILGFGIPQLVYGPLTDRFGRRPVLFVALAGYIACAVASTLVTTFSALLVARFVMGVFSSGCRVVAVSVVRDVYAGRAMAEIMSLVMTIFMVVPILAPALGQLVLFGGSWHLIFWVLALYAAIVFAWTLARLGETLPETRRTPLNLASAIGAYVRVVRTRVTFGYLLASGIVFGSLFAFIASAEQVMTGVFGMGEEFVLWFAIVAGGLACANFLNSRLVQRLGMRRLSHIALVGFTIVSAANLVLMATMGPVFPVFFPLFVLAFAFFGMMGSNFNALAMEPLGEIAGTASAAYGFATTTLAGLIGGAIGRQFDGTVLPILAGFTVLGLAGLAIVLVTERGKLFGQ